jgi:hypothetical protein
LKAVLLDLGPRGFAAALLKPAGTKADHRSVCKRMAAMSFLEGTAPPREPFQHRITWRKLGVIADKLQS